ncbi:MAG: type III pantothenate kinase [Bacteroidetes bacterium]|nr:type III pantothenate kinase [Bacteroidota bacterium]
MKYLLLDIGNSVVKSAVSENEILSRVKSFPYAKENFEPCLSAAVSTHKDKGISAAWISLLDKRRKHLVSEIIRKKAGITKIKFAGVTSILPIKINYGKTLGSDRICSSAAALFKFGRNKNILVFDFGTATTVNFIRGGVYKGGMIAAGLITAAKSLDARTTLPRVFLSAKISEQSKTTPPPIASGLVLQQVFFAEKTLEIYKRKYGPVFSVGTGGNLSRLKKHLKSIDAFDDNLVLEGLNIIKNYNENIR